MGSAPEALRRPRVRRAHPGGAGLAFAATIGRVEGPEAGLAALDRVGEAAVGRFQPAWATRAHLLEEAGRLEEAGLAYQKAISLTTEGGPRRYLEARCARCLDPDGATGRG